MEKNGRLWEKSVMSINFMNKIVAINSIKKPSQYHFYWADGNADQFAQYLFSGYFFKLLF
jgi:hypothetical protein